jgi:hypothetical protein
MLCREGPELKAAVNRILNERGIELELDEYELGNPGIPDARGRSPLLTGLSCGCEKRASDPAHGGFLEVELHPPPISSYSRPMRQ